MSNGNDKINESGELPPTLGRGSNLGTMKDFKRGLKEFCKRRRLRKQSFNPFGEKLGGKGGET